MFSGYSERCRPLGLYFLEKTHVVVTSLTTGFQLYTRSAGVAHFILGALSCSLSVKILKMLLREPRPIGRSKKVTYGMPSTHAATMTYYACYICAACLCLPTHKSLWHSSTCFTTTVPIIIVPWASLVVTSRVWLGHHTWKQVAVGSGYGACFASMWFALWTRGLNVYGSEGEKWMETILGSSN